MCPPVTNKNAIDGNIYHTQYHFSRIVAFGKFQNAMRFKLGKGTTSEQTSEREKAAYGNLQFFFVGILSAATLPRRFYRFFILYF